MEMGKIKNIAQEKGLIITQDIEAVKNEKEKFIIQDISGYKYSLSFKEIYENKTPPKPFARYNPHTINNIHNYLKINNIPATLISNVYCGNSIDLLWKCPCGNTFKRNWNNFTRKSQVCPNCGTNERYAKEKAETFKKVKKYFDEHNYQLLSKEYINHIEELEYICNVHRDKGIQKIKWVNCKKGHGCKYCGIEKLGIAHRVSESELRRITEDAGFIYVRAEYENENYHKTIIHFTCPNHKDKGVQTKTLANMKKSQGKCNYCLGKNRTHEDFLKEMQKINPTILIRSKYKTATNPIDCKCAIDGHEWMSNGNELLAGRGCKICAIKISSQKRKKTHEQFEKEIQDKYNGQISILSEYTGIHDKIKCKCNVDNTVWETTATALLNNNSIACPTCISNKISSKFKMSHKEFLNKLNKTNPDIEPLEKYDGSGKKILCRCKVHNHKWYVTPNKLLTRRTGCPKCASYHNENIIDTILDSWGYKYSIQKTFSDCKDKNLLPFDRYLDDFNVLIEYDGEGHYIPITYGKMTLEQAQESLEKTQAHDKIKDNYCKAHNIPLIRIPYWEKDNIETYLFDKMAEYGAIEIMS